jgi:transglutaminase-like putative cysteine protease
MNFCSNEDFGSCFRNNTEVKNPMKHMKGFSLLLSAVMLVMVFVPLASATNQTNPTPPGWVGQFDEWAGQKDMSAYSVIIPTVPVKKMDAQTAKAYPGVEVISPDMKFPTGNNFIDVEKSSMKAAKINFVTPESKTNVVAKAAAVIPTVAPEYGYFNWYWTQDTVATQTVVIHNYGSTAASGLVYFVSMEDGFGTPAEYLNLAPGANVSVSIPFMVVGSQSTVGIKPMGFFITVGPENTVTWSGQLDLNGIEKYNNDALHLLDPDGGDNLETSDLYHFPFSEGYAIILEAATAADNTNSPFETANTLNTYVNDTMHYVDSDTNELYAASDLYVINQGYEGVCDEYATMDVTFSRSLGIPSRFLGITWVNETGHVFGHGILENRVGSTWVHSDPTWHIFNNPQIYKLGNNTHMNLTKYTDADDNRYTVDPVGDGLLRYEDLVAQPLGELPGYN